jgi:hypothetical protein
VDLYSNVGHSGGLYRYELTGELYDDDETRSFYEDDIVNFDTEQREAITFRSWLQEYLLHRLFYEKTPWTRGDRHLQPTCISSEATRG